MAGFRHGLAIAAVLAPLLAPGEDLPANTVDAFDRAVIAGAPRNAFPGGAGRVS